MVRVSYIDSTYYNDTYMGKPPTPSMDISRLIMRASEVIDKLTAFRIAKGEVILAEAHPFVQESVKKATAAMVEYYVINGGYERDIEVDQESSVNIGSFSYSVSDKEGKKGMAVPNQVMEYLTHTGLLYTGINTSGGGGVYYED